MSFFTFFGGKFLGPFSEGVRLVPPVLFWRVFQGPPELEKITRLLFLFWVGIF